MRLINKFSYITILYFFFSACSASDNSATSGDENNPVENNFCNSSNLVINEDFNQYDVSEKYTIGKAQQDFGPILARTSAEIRGLDGNDKTWPHKTRVNNGLLRAEYLKYKASGRYGGFLFDKAFADAEEATMEYRVKFDKNLVWRYGGKLPGLGGTSLDGSGVTIPAGCTQNLQRINNGFSARLMWRQSGGSGPARLVVYTYLPDRNIEKCGVEHSFFDGLEKGKWYTIRQYIKLNTPGQRDGVIRMYVNDELAVEEKDILYRKAGKGDVKINNAIFHTYRGGAAEDPRWQSPTTDYIYFDDFKVWAG